MKKYLLIIAIALIASISTIAQKTEVLYFKAQLGCCMARSCDALQNDIKLMVTENFKTSDVIFKEVRITDTANANLVKKYNARSQTVVIVNTSKEDSFQDISQNVRTYLRTSNKEEFQKELIANINKNLK
jgi:hypothetical protein